MQIGSLYWDLSVFYALVSHRASLVIHFLSTSTASASRTSIQGVERAARHTNTLLFLGLTSLNRTEILLTLIRSSVMYRPRVKVRAILWKFLRVCHHLRGATHNLNLVNLIINLLNILLNILLVQNLWLLVLLFFEQIGELILQILRLILMLVLLLVHHRRHGLHVLRLVHAQ